MYNSHRADSQFAMLAKSIPGPEAGKSAGQRSGHRLGRRHVGGSLMTTTTTTTTQGATGRSGPGRDPKPVHPTMWASFLAANEGSSISEVEAAGMVSSRGSKPLRSIKLQTRRLSYGAFNRSWHMYGDGSWANTRGLLYPPWGHGPA